MSSTVELDFKIVANQATQQLKTLNNSVKKVGEQVSVTKIAFANMLGAAALSGITAAVRGMVDLAKSSIQAASDAEETKSKFSTVFKSMGDEGEAAAVKLAESYGLTTTASKTLLSNTGDLLTGFGFAQDKALTLSVSVQELAVDLASFTNYAGGAKGASEALTKALLGETESLKSLGISISQADVQKQIAINSANGLTFATEKEAKAQATFDLALRQSGNALGDYARTSTGFANQQRQLGALTTDISEKFGAELLPSINRVVGGTIALIKENKVLIASMAEGLGNALKAVIDGLVAFGTHLQENAKWYKPLAVGLGIVGLALIVLAAKAAIATISFQALAVSAATAWVAVTGPIALAVYAIAAFGAAMYALWANWDQVVGFMKQKSLELAAAFVNFGAMVLEAIAPIEPAFRLMAGTLIKIWAWTTGAIIQSAFDLADKVGGLFGYELPDSLKNFQDNLLDSADAMIAGGGAASAMAKDMRAQAASLNASADAVAKETAALTENTKEAEKNKEAKKPATTEGGGVDVNAADVAAKQAALEREAKFQEDLKAIKDEAKLLREEERLVESEEELIKTDEKFAKMVEDLGRENAIKIQAATNLGLGKAELDTMVTKAEIDQSKARLSNVNNEYKERKKIQDRQSKQFQFTEKAKAKWEEGTWSDRIDQTRTGLTALSGLQNSSNSAAFAVGKSAAIINATMQTYQAATGAYASLAGIPVVGPALGGVAAAAAVIAGLANVAKIKSQQAPKKSTFATGGVVPGTATTGDTQMAYLNSNEVVLNGKQQANTLFQMSNNSGGGDSSMISAIQDLGNRIMNMEIVVQASDYEIGRSVNRSIGDGLILQTA